jgi:hypothetical protein
VETCQSTIFFEDIMKSPKPISTAALLAGILERIKSGQEPPEECVKYRHVAGEISAWGALFADRASLGKSNLRGIRKSVKSVVKKLS